jgi:hypothetical protein
LCNGELDDLYFSPNIIQVIKSNEMGDRFHIMHGEKINMYKILVGKTEGKRPL